MSKLAFLVYVIVAPTLAGILVIAALTLDMYSNKAVAGAAILGFVLALPAAWIIGRQIRSSIKY